MYYIVPSLVTETPDRIILHGGCNYVNNKNSTPEKIANKIADMPILKNCESISNKSILRE